MSRRPDRAGAQMARWRARDGFTLIEVLVAFSVMGLLLSVLFRGVVTMRAGSNAFDAHTQGDLVARAVLDDALARRDGRNGRLSGLRDGRRWTVTAAPIDLSSQLPAPPPNAPGAPPPTGNATAPNGNPPNPAAADAKPAWVPQRLVVQIETGGRPIAVETIRLVRAE